MHQEIHNSESESFFKSLGNLLPYPIWLGAVDGTITYFNNAVYAYSGLNSDELNSTNWLKIVHPDDHKINIDSWVHSITTGEEFILEHRLLRNDGQYRWNLNRAIPLKDNDGQIILWVGTALDIHDQKMQTEVLEEKVIARTKELERKNKELEQFVYAASHDMQEPLRKIRTFISMINEQGLGGLNDKQIKLLVKIDDSSSRMKNLLDEILHYSFNTYNELQLSRVNLNELIISIQFDLELLISEKKGVIFFKNLPVLNAAPTQCYQLFYNLIHNALKFSKADCSPEISIKAELANDDENHINILISDNGIGFEQSFAEKIFIIFQRLHEKNIYEGSGIGLSLCKKIAHNHNWDIHVKSEINTGTTFIITIPKVHVLEFYRPVVEFY